MNRVPRWRIAAACLVLALLAGLSVVLAPIYYNNLQIQHSVAETTRDAASQTKPDDAIRLVIVKRAQELDLPVKADNVHIDRSEQRLRVDVRYFVRVSLPGYTVDLHFHPAASSQ